MRVAAIVVGTVFLALALARPMGADEGELVVITHPSRSVALTPGDVRRLFLKQRRFWPDGRPVIAINQSAATPTRLRFDHTIFGRDARDLASYWNQRYFEGQFPPLTLGSDEAVQRYVATKPDAVGYVSAGAVDGSVHVALRLPRGAPGR